MMRSPSETPESLPPRELHPVSRTAAPARIPIFVLMPLPLTPPSFCRRSGQGVKPLRETVEGDRDADALLLRLEDVEGRHLARLELADERLLHHHLGDAARGEAAHEAGAADVRLVDLEAEPG